jgi:hypothetical protein
MDVVGYGYVLRQLDDAERGTARRSRAKICDIAPKIFSSAVEETEMMADPKRKSHQDDGDSDKRSHQEEALDEALKNTFPASDPVSVEQRRPAGAAAVPQRTVNSRTRLL